MIPIKGKQYAIACMGPYDYNMYKGVALHTGDVQTDIGTENDPASDLYGFHILESSGMFWFAEEDILCEAANQNISTIWTGVSSNWLGL